MRLRACVVTTVVLVVVGLATAVPAEATTSAQTRYITALHHAARSTKGVSTKKLLGLGSAICGILKVGSVADEIGILQERSNAYHFPKNQVTAIVATSVTHLCPSHTNAVVAYEKKQRHPSAPAVVAAPTTTTAPPTTTTTAPRGPVLTQQQQTAVAEAKQYLSTESFSQAGLIAQLDSPDGGGYSANDATVAVDSLTENWNAEAVQSAKDYMQTEPMSCADLIQQLDSPDGDQYTVAQATYGATQAGDCSGGVPTGATGSTGNTP
jgi:hypothetical protein